MRCVYGCYFVDGRRVYSIGIESNSQCVHILFKSNLAMDKEINKIKFTKKNMYLPRKKFNIEENIFATVNHIQIVGSQHNLTYRVRIRAHNDD